MRKLNIILNAQRYLPRSIPSQTRSPASLFHYIKPEGILPVYFRLHEWRGPLPIPRFCNATLSYFCSVASSEESVGVTANPFRYNSDQDVEVIDEWEEEDDAEPKIGDGRDGGGIVLQNLSWGDRVLSIAIEVLKDFGKDIKLFAFKISPRGYIYVRLDKLTNEYGCPSMEEIESYSQKYKKQLDDEGARGEIPENLALEVSSPGADRLLRVPDDLDRFSDFPMTVTYFEDTEKGKSMEKNGVFLLDSIEDETSHCVWKLADVKENRDPLSKGRPMSRKLKDWRLKLHFAMHKKVAFYSEF